MNDPLHDPLEGMSVYDRAEWVQLWMECMQITTGEIITYRQGYEALLRAKEMLIE